MTATLADSLAARRVADIRKRDEWNAARPGRIGASDAAKYAKFESVDLYVRAKLLPPWGGGEFADWGHEREPIILADHGVPQNHFMYHHPEFPRFVATPDGIHPEDGRFVQIKTTIKDFRSKRTGEVLVPAHYRRQVWWEQFVGGPEYTVSDFIFEGYRIENGVYLPNFEATVVKIERDDAEIAKMARIAHEVCRRLDLSNF